MATGVQTAWSMTAASNDSADTNINWAEGQAPSTVNNSARAEMAAIKKFVNDISGTLTTGGGATAYTLTTNEVFGSLVNGQMVAFRPHVGNGYNPTLNVDSRGAKPLRGLTGAPLLAGVLPVNSPVTATYFSGADEWLIRDFRYPGRVALLSGAPSSANTSDVAFAAATYTGYQGFEIIFQLIPATDGANLHVRLSTDGGSNFATSGYAWSNNNIDTAGANAVASDDSDAQIVISQGIGSQTNEGVRGRILLTNPLSTGLWPVIHYETAKINTDASGGANTGMGYYNVTQDTDGLRFLFSSGQIASGVWRLYGLP